MNKNSVLCLYGPTATGKTDIAVELVEKYPFEIISVDSALVYRGMDIGTAKPDAETLARAPHRLIDICDPHDVYSVAKFRADAMSAIQEIHSAGKTPLLVGGTLLYFRALFDGLSPLPSSNPEVRGRLERRVEVEGLEVLHAYLLEVDPLAGERIHPNDPQRILRALEVYELTNTPITTLQQKKMPKLGDDYEVLKVGLMPENRGQLHARIGVRFEMMLEAGFLDEMKVLMSDEKLSPELPSMRSVGYRQAWQHLAGELSHDEMIDRAVIATRQLAKRQITWMRSTPTDMVFDPFQNSCSEVSEVIAKRMMSSSSIDKLDNS